MDEEGIKLLCKVLVHVYDTGELLDNFLRSVFIALPKKSNAGEYKDLRIISIMSYPVTLLAIIMERIRSRSRPEISEEQFGFMPDRGNKDAILTLRMMFERAIQHQQVVFSCFTDYVKAFDKLQHEEFSGFCKILTLMARTSNWS